MLSVLEDRDNLGLKKDSKLIELMEERNVWSAKRKRTEKRGKTTSMVWRPFG
jgi:hypothetical protein